MNVISKFLFKNVVDYLKGSTFVMVDKVFDIFQKEDSRPMMFDYSCHIKEKGPLCITSETMRPVESVFL